MAQLVMYSSTEVETTPTKNTLTGSLMYGPKIETMMIAPTPYIGQYGPFKKPLLINFFFGIEQNTTSQHHPITA